MAAPASCAEWREPTTESTRNENASTSMSWSVGTTSGVARGEGKGKTRMDWAALLPCGTVTARFDDGSSALLHPSGARFISQSPDGTRVTHLTRFVTHQHCKKVREMLDFRNSYSAEPPMLCRELLFESDNASITTCPVPTTSTWWHASVSAALNAEDSPKATVLDDGTACVISVDGAARLTLAPHGKFFSVSYLAYAPLLSTVQGKRQDSRADKEHWRLDRMYSCHPDLVPDCWQHPLWIAQRLRGGYSALSETHRSDGLQMQHQVGLDSVSSQQAGDSVHIGPQSFVGSDERPLAHNSAGAGGEARGKYVQSELPAMAALPSSAVPAAAHAEGMDDPLASREGGCDSVIEWTPSHLLRYVGTDGSVEVSSFADNSVHVVCVQGRFLTSYAAHMRGYDAVSLCIHGPTIPRLLLPASLNVEVVHRALSIQAAHRRRPVSSLPRHPHNQSLGKRLDDGVLLASARSTQLLKQGGAGSGWAPAYSAEVLLRTSSEGVGVFTAYKDGRARCHFADRAIAELTPDQSTARIILPSGEEVEVRTGAAFGVESYVVLLQQFSAWAFRTEPQRVAIHREQEGLQRRVQEELFKIRRLQHAPAVA